MARNTTIALKETQPDLLGGSPSQPKVETAVKEKKAPAKDQPKKKAKIATIQPKPAFQAVAVRKAPEPKNMLAVIAAAASNPACDVGKMQALLDMQEKLEQKQAKREFTEDFIALQSELPSISRDGKIEVLKKGADGQRVAGRDQVQQSTPYATFNNIMRTIKPLLNKHHFTLSFATEPAGERIIVKGFLRHVSTHEQTTAFPLPAETSGSKNNVQGWGSSMSYGKRYATIALLNIISHAPEDADRNGATPQQTEKKASGNARSDDVEVIEDGEEKITQEQHDKLIDAIEACGAKRSDFCGAWKIAKVADLPASGFERAMKACDEKMKGKPRG